MWTQKRYRFIEPLGMGGMGGVFLALDIETGERVAIKTAASQGQPSRMREEAELLRSLPDWRVPSTPRFIDYFEENGRTFLVQEYLEGQELRGWQQQSPSIAEFFDVYARLAHAIERIHEAGIVHRDLKPSNILLVKGRPYLLDFGLSVHLGDDDQGSTVVGTPVYLAPEMLLGSTRQECAADVFSLGVMLYEGMMGEWPFKVGGTFELLTIRATQDLSSEVRFPELGLPASIVEVFRTMLSIRPSSRPPAAKVATALHAAAALARLELESTTVPLPAPPRRERGDDLSAAPSVLGSDDLHRAAFRIAELEAHLERTTKLTESLAIAVKDLGDKLNPDTFQAMVRRSVLISMCDLETPTYSSEIEHAVRVAIEYLTGIPGNQRHSSVGNEVPVPSYPLRHTILFLAANPSGTDPRALDREARAIRMELERSGFRTCFELVTRWAAEPLDLLRELRRLRPTVVHFSGHGAPEVAGEPRLGLCFQGSDGRGQLVSTAALEETFGAVGASVKLVVLNACYSELQAQALLAHIDCVVGVSGSIRDDAARSFAIGFYGGLGERESVAVAYKQGCAAITLEGLPDSVRPQLKVRTGIDATRVVLAAVPPRSGPPGRPRRS